MNYHSKVNSHIQIWTSVKDWKFTWRYISIKCWKSFFMLKLLHNFCIMIVLCALMYCYDVLRRYGYISEFASFTHVHIFLNPLIVNMIKFTFTKKEFHRVWLPKNVYLSMHNISYLNFSKITPPQSVFQIRIYKHFSMFLSQTLLFFSPTLSGISPHLAEDYI